MKKSDVNGDNELPLYTYLKSEIGFNGLGNSDMAKKLSEMFSKMNPNWDIDSRLKWNFTKFIVDRNGKVVKIFEPTADMNEVEECIKSLL